MFFLLALVWILFFPFEGEDDNSWIMAVVILASCVFSYVYWPSIVIRWLPKLEIIFLLLALIITFMISGYFLGRGYPVGDLNDQVYLTFAFLFPAMMIFAGYRVQYT